MLSACHYYQSDKSKSAEASSTKVLNGLQKNYRKDKTMLSAINYKDGKRHGISRSYFEDGKTIRNEIIYVNGIKNGLTKSYFRTGKILYTVNYVNGKRDGIMKRYYRSGELMAETPYKNGRIQEGLIEYQKTGKIKMKYPEIIFEEIDNTAFERKYIVKVKLSNDSKNVKFYRIYFDESGNEVSEKRLSENKSFIDVNYYLSRGEVIVDRLKIRAEFKTFLDNTYVIYKEKQIKISW